MDYRFITKDEAIPWNPPIGKWPRYFKKIYKSEKLGTVLLAGEGTPYAKDMATYWENEIDLIRTCGVFKDSNVLEILHLIKTELPGSRLERVEPTHEF